MAAHAKVTEDFELESRIHTWNMENIVYTDDELDLLQDGELANELVEPEDEYPAVQNPMERFF